MTVTTAEARESIVTLSRWRTELSLVVRDAPEVAAGRVLREEVFRMETAASRFRTDSEISIVNASPGEWVPVTWYFADILEAALAAARWTDGLVDPGLGRAVDAAGYRHWRGDGVPTPSLSATDSSWRDIEIRPAGSHALVRIPPGLSLDVGAVAKGWLADRVAERAVRELGGDALANMGGDLRAIAATEPWTVIADPERPDRVESELVVWDAGLATSGTGRRSWRNPDGSVGHHIIDSRTGQPAVTPWHVCSVLAASAAAANSGSTAGIILGAEGPAWLAERALDGWFLGDDGEERVGRWP